MALIRWVTLLARADCISLTHFEGKYRVRLDSLAGCPLILTPSSGIMELPSFERSFGLENDTQESIDNKKV